MTVSLSFLLTFLVVSHGDPDSEASGGGRRRLAVFPTVDTSSGQDARLLDSLVDSAVGEAAGGAFVVMAPMDVSRLAAGYQAPDGSDVTSCASLACQLAWAGRLGFDVSLATLVERDDATCSVTMRLAGATPSPVVATERTTCAWSGLVRAIQDAARGVFDRSAADAAGEEGGPDEAADDQQAAPRVVAPSRPVAAPPAPPLSATAPAGDEPARVAAPVAPRRLPAGADGWVLIRPGAFEMGSPSWEEGHRRDEWPVNQVGVPQAFLMRATELTQREWKKLMKNNPSAFASCGDDCPVDTVNWWEAVAYCNRLSRAEGLPECYELKGCDGYAGEDMECERATFRGSACPGYRLPTEVEWEYAVRAGSDAPTYGPLGDIAWSSAEHAQVSTQPVAGKLPNAWGLYDLIGNVWEWCHDTYAPYPDEPAPGYVSDSDEGGERVARGGSYLSKAANVRAAARDRADADDTSIGRYRGNAGFRPVRTVRDEAGDEP